MQPPDNNNSSLSVLFARPYGCGVLIFLAALAVRVIFLWDFRHCPTFDVPIIDAMEYDQLARQWVFAGVFKPDFFWQPIFYPLFLSGVYALSAGSIVYAMFMQCLVGSAACVLLWRVAVRVFDPAVAMIAALIMAIYPPLLFHESQLLATGWAVFWTPAILLAGIRLAEKPNVLSAGVTGAVAMLAISTRPEFAPFLIALPIGLIIVWRRKKVLRRAMTPVCCGAILGAAVIAGPIAGLSYHKLGKIQILPDSGGINFYIGNNPDYKNTINIRPGRGWKTLTELPFRHGAADNSQAQRFFIDKTKDYLFAHPAAFAAGLAGKTLEFLSSRELPRNEDIYLYREWSILLRGGVFKIGPVGLPLAVILSLAAVGAWRRRKSIPLILWLFLILFPAAVILVFVSSRYRMPILPVWILLASAGLVELVRLMRARRVGAILIAGIIMVSVGLLSSLPGPFPAEQYDYLPELFYCRGGSLENQGRIDQAIDSYQRAIDLKPDYVEAHHNLGLVLAGRGRYDEAIRQYQLALACDRNNTDIALDWGRAILDIGNAAEALRICERILGINPDLTAAYLCAANASLKLEQPHLAEQYARQALAINPADPDSRITLGTILIALNQSDEALAQFDQACLLPIDKPALWLNLANGYARLKRYDLALQIYDLAVKFDPRNYLIQYNFGVCLYEQSRWGDAAEKFKAAIALNPSFAQAYSSLADSLEKQGLVDQARETYRSLLKLNPNDSDAQKALQRLTSKSP